MPIYEYRCGGCQRRVSILFRGYSSTDHAACPRCGSPNLTRLVSRVAFHRSTGSSDDDLGDAFGGLDEDDPRAMARSLRAMTAESGEPLEPEMEEALGRLEAGEDPEAVMGELEGSEGDMASPDYDEY